MKFKWYTNGTTDIKVYDGMIIPSGFIPGRRTKGREAWTVRDVIKLKIARDNNLNFMFIYKDNLIIDR